jgi:hypothetical protein
MCKCTYRIHPVLCFVAVVSYLYRLRSFKFKTCKTNLQSKSKISKLENQKKKKEWTRKKIGERSLLAEAHLLGPSHQPTGVQPGVMKRYDTDRWDPPVGRRPPSSSSSCMLDRASPARPPRRAAFRDHLISIDFHVIVSIPSSLLAWVTKRFAPDHSIAATAISRPSPVRR